MSTPPRVRGGETTEMVAGQGSGHARLRSSRPVAGSTISPATSGTRRETKGRSDQRGCGTMSSAESITSDPKKIMSTSSVRAPLRTPRTRPAEVSTAWASFRRVRAPRLVHPRSTRFRKSGCGGAGGHAGDSTILDTASIDTALARSPRPRSRCARRWPRFDPRERMKGVAGFMRLASRAPAFAPRYPRPTQPGGERSNRCRPGTPAGSHPRRSAAPTCRSVRPAAKIVRRTFVTAALKAAPLPPPHAHEPREKRGEAPAHPTPGHAAAARCHGVTIRMDSRPPTGRRSPGQVCRSDADRRQVAPGGGSGG